MKKLIFELLILISSVLFAVSCSNTGDNKEPEGKPNTGNNHTSLKGIVGRGVVEVDTRSEYKIDTIAFTDANIKSFSTVSREIKFQNDPYGDIFEPGSNLIPYTQIVFLLDGETLFRAATIVSDHNSKEYRDLVLYINRNNKDYRYYLHDAYPLTLAESDEARTNALAREEGWNKFLDHLRDSHRLIEYDVEPSFPDEGNNPGSYIPDTPHNNTGTIELIRFTQKAEWNFIDINPNTLNVVRSEDELKSLITTNSYSPSNVDFANYTLVLVRIVTPNGINEISYALDSISENKYGYSMKVFMNETCEIGDEICAVLAPTIKADEEVSFDIDITYKVE